MRWLECITDAMGINLSKLLETGEKAMATHPSTVAWKIPWTEEPGGLQPIGVAKSQT